MGNTCCSSSADSEIENIKSQLESFQDLNSLDGLISFIEERLIAIGNDNPQHTSVQARPGSSTSSGLPSLINLGSRFSESVLKRVNKPACKMCCKRTLGRETRKVVIDLLKGAGKVQVLAAALSVLGYALDQFDQDCTNKTQCVQLLKYMCDLAKRAQQLNEELPHEKEKLTDVIHFIVEGSIMCFSQMKSHNLYGFFSASVDAEDLRTFESRLSRNYEDLGMAAVIELLRRAPIVLPPTQPKDQTQGADPHTFGVQKAVEDVVGLLKMGISDESRIAVVIYGIGGAGKTTLATAVYSRLDLKAYKFCRLNMPEFCSEEHLKVLQQQILNDILGKNINLRDFAEGKEELTKAFREASYPVFMFIDNALDHTGLAELLPQDLSFLPKHTRILMTTRKLDETSMLSKPGIIQRFAHCVQFLDPENSKKLVCKIALESASLTFPQGVDIDRLVEVCGGIPLILELVGYKLRDYVNDPSACNELIKLVEDALTEGETDYKSERVVDVVYNSLESSSKEAFLDIACFFHNCQKRIVTYVVGKVPLQALENAGLVKVSHEQEGQSTCEFERWKEEIDLKEGIIKVHDVVRARGRRLSQGERIMDVKSLEEAMQDGQKLQRIKGIWLSDLKVKFDLLAEHLDLMNTCKRVLCLKSSSIKIKGICKSNFQNVRYLSLGYSDTLPIDMNKVNRLAFLQCRMDDTIGKLPGSLKYMSIWPSNLSDENICKLSSLEDLTLHPQSSLATLPSNFGQLNSLRFLDLSYCRELTALPESFGNLPALETLSLEGCNVLARLPENFGQLKSLKLLIMNGCSSLATLPERFGNMSNLQKLDLIECSNLVSLPESFGNMSNLQKLNLSECYNLVSLSESFGNMSNLQKLNLSKCSRLVSLPESFGNVCKLQLLTLSKCSNLEGLPKSFGKLNSLDWLVLNNCKKLSSLSDKFGQLESLVTLEARYCFELEGKTINTLVGMKRLMSLDIGRSPMLIERWKQVKGQHTLLVSYDDEGLISHSDLVDVLESALFNCKSRFEEVGESISSSSFPPPHSQVAFLLTRCHLSSSSHQQTFEIVKQKSAELASQGYHVIYVKVAEGFEEEEETVVHLSRACKWIAPDKKTNLLFAYALCWYLQVDMKWLYKTHTLIARARIYADEEGKRRVENLSVLFPVNQEDFEAVVDVGGRSMGTFVDSLDNKLFNFK